MTRQRMASVFDLNFSITLYNFRNDSPAKLLVQARNNRFGRPAKFETQIWPVSPTRKSKNNLLDDLASRKKLANNSPGGPFFFYVPEAFGQISDLAKSNVPKWKISNFWIRNLASLCCKMISLITGNRVNLFIVFASVQTGLHGFATRKFRAVSSTSSPASCSLSEQPLLDENFTQKSESLWSSKMALSLAHYKPPAHCT